MSHPTRWALGSSWGCLFDRMTRGNHTVVHASCVSYGGAAVLILGASGAGKSALALHLLAFGAQLVCDDRVCLSVEDERLIATPAPAISGLIEARGVGLLHSDFCARAPVTLVVDLDQKETERLPQRHHITLCDITLTLLRKPEAPHFAHAILQFLKAGRQETT